jgi:hypothetical protein
VKSLIRSPYLICYKSSLSSAIVSIITLTLTLINIIALCSLIFKINLRFFHHKSIKSRDGNSGTGTQPDGYRDDFLPADDTRTRPESRWVFFLPMDNLTGTRYFTTAIILGCEQVKMCLFCYINYDLF